MTKQRVLVSGAGIAGMGLAHWLSRGNHEVVLIDRFRAFNPQGHFMTLKGACVDLIKAMGQFETLRSHEWPSTQWDWYTNDGRCLRRVSKADIGETLSGFLAVRRADLHGVLRDSLPASVEFRIGTEIDSLVDRGDVVEVTFFDGSQGSFDIVVGADGVRSTLRSRHFPELTTQSLGGHYIVLVVNFCHQLEGCTRTVWGQGRSVSLIPLRHDQLGLMIYQDELVPAPPTTDDPLAWRSYLSAVYDDFPSWVRDGVMALQEGDEIFADRILMVPATTVTKGRVALVGDAGYCPTFFSGMGAAAALLGAYSFAHQLDKHKSAPAALAAYESLIVPLVQDYQRSAKGGPRRTMARGADYVLRNLMTVAIPDRLARAASRRQYKSDVTLQALS